MRQSVPINQLIDELAAFARNGEALLEALGNNAEGEMREAKERARESIAAAKEHFARLQDYLSSGAHAAVDAGETYVRDNPWKAIMLAAGIGLLVGTLLSRPRSG
jgi:ElaB/YqjD/DUF883 family membrane-anchored ribosome-binding protein